APDPFADQDGRPGHRPIPGPAGPGPNQTGGEEGPVLEMGEQHRLELERCVAAHLGRHRDEELPRLGGDADPTGHRPHIPPAADVIPRRDLVQDGVDVVSLAVHRSAPPDPSSPRIPGGRDPTFREPGAGLPWRGRRGERGWSPRASRLGATQPSYEKMAPQPPTYGVPGSA